MLHLNAVGVEHAIVGPTGNVIGIDMTEAMIEKARVNADKLGFNNVEFRLGEIEKLALGFEGVEKAYALTAGREIRVFVIPEKVSDLEAQKMARDIAIRIESELKYPGEIKVNVIRENRSIEFAR